MLSTFTMNFSLVIFVFLVGIFKSVVSQSINEPLFNRGCRANRGQFPHETFCQQYYNCWDGRATIEECPGKLLFNPVISACDYPEAVNCGARLRNPEPAVTADGRCLKQFGIFPDITDCTAFYKCSHGRAYRQICPYYTAFDERYLVCVHAYEVDCGGRGGVYGTLAPPNFDIPVGGIAIIPGSGTSGSSSGWDRRTPPQAGGSASGSASAGSQGTGTAGGGRRGGPARGSGGSQAAGGSGAGSRGGVGGSGTGGSTSGSGTGSDGISGGGAVSGGSGRGTGTSGSTTGRGTGSSGGTAGRGTGASGSTAGRGTGSSGSSGRGTSGSSATGGSSGSGARGPAGTTGGITGTRGGAGASSGTHAGITGIVDKDISATGHERQYERPISPEATFRCPHPRGLYANALDCSRFWLCREYKPSLLKCPTGQLFDLASLSCTSPEKAQCSSISPRT